MSSTLLSGANGERAVASESNRIKLQDNLRGAADAMETPNDLMVRLVNTHLEVAMTKAGCDLGIFKRLAESGESLSVEQFSKETSADPLLMRRILRYLASRRMIVEISKDNFQANNSTHSLADPVIEGGLYYVFEIAGPAYQALPGFMQETKYQSPPAGRCAWQNSVGTDQDFFPYMKQHPEQLQWFQKLMSVPRDGDWLDVVYFEKEAANVSADRALLVDVGGNIGHQSERLRRKYPDLPGKIIVQDLEENVKVAPQLQGVEFMAHDFFTPQPIKGARFYYLRTVLHDWDDEKSEKILRQIIPAMSPDSQILIDDMALPDNGTHWWSASLDMHMYTMLGALERTVEQWRTLLDRSGLKLVEIRTYQPVMRHSIIIAEPK